MTTHQGAADLCRLLGIRRPVLLAPMARIAGGALAGAVSAAGGLGVLGAGYGDPGWLAEQVPHAGGQRVGIGLITWHMSEGAVERALAFDPAALWLSFGDPRPHVAQIHEAGAVAICQVSLLDEAVAAASAGADVLVVQGNEAGGHGRPNHTRNELLEMVIAADLGLPVVAAGGVNGGDDLADAIAIGAAGVAVGTALYATTEADDSSEAKQHLVASSGEDTVISRVYDHVRGPLWPEGYTGRSVRTELTDRFAEAPQAVLAELDEVRSRYGDAAAASDMTVRVLWAGAGLDGVTSINSAAEIVARFPEVQST